jgi:hypothetical protein
LARKVKSFFIRSALLLVLVACSADSPLANAAVSQPETVLVNFHVKQGQENQLTRLLSDAWEIYKKHGMVRSNPHTVLRGKDRAGKPLVVEIFTWKDSSVPDNAPSDVRAVWKSMEALCEARAGESGINFTEMEIVEP